MLSSPDTLLAVDRWCAHWQAALPVAGGVFRVRRGGGVGQPRPGAAGSRGRPRPRPAIRPGVGGSAGEGLSRTWVSATGPNSGTAGRHGLPVGTLAATSICCRLFCWPDGQPKVQEPAASAMTSSCGARLRLLPVLAAALSFAAGGALGSSGGSSGSHLNSKAANAAAAIFSGGQYGNAAGQLRRHHKRRHHKGAHGDDDGSCEACWPDRWGTVPAAAP